MFLNLDTLPEDPIYGMQAIYKKDPRAHKVNLSIGVCLDEQGKLLSFEAIKRAESAILAAHSSKEYLPIGGMAEYCHKAETLICGKDCPMPLFSIQTVGGTGALYLTAKLLKKAKIEKAFIPDPSWPNHKPLFEAAGIEIKTYPYYDPANSSFDFYGAVEAIAHMPEGSGIILQASCHNPTGIDPTLAQWKILSAAIKKQKLIPIFDLAYLGLGDDLETDVLGIRTFLQDQHNMLISSTFSKSFGLYNDRIAILTVASANGQFDAIGSHLRAIARSTYSSPPAHGAYLISKVLGDPALTSLWQSELKKTCERLQKQRKMLFDALQQNKARLNYSHLLGTKGLFCLFSLTKEQVISLREERALYVALDGRISLASITEQNVQHVASALATI